MDASLRTCLAGLVLAALSLPLPALATCVCRCEQKQVWSEAQQRYVWREICE